MDLSSQNNENARLCDVCGERPGVVQVMFAGGGSRRTGLVCETCAREMMAAQQGGGLHAERVLRLVDAGVDLIFVTEPVARGVAGLVQALVDLVAVIAGRVLDVVEINHGAEPFRRDNRNGLTLAHCRSRPA